MGTSRSIWAISLLVCLAFAAANSVRATTHHDHRQLEDLEESDLHKSDNCSLASDIDATLNESLRVPAGNRVRLLLLGVGYQIYSYNGTAWVLTNVSADLYNFKGNRVGYHFYLAELDENGGRPTWETFRPASRVTGRAVANVPVDADSINWLLIVATSNSGSRKLLGSTTYVQRLYTHQGLPPDADYPTGDDYYSSYHAVYTFSSEC